MTGRSTSGTRSNLNIDTGPESESSFRSVGNHARPDFSNVNIENGTQSHSTIGRERRQKTTDMPMYLGAPSARRIYEDDDRQNERKRKHEADEIHEGAPAPLPGGNLPSMQHKPAAEPERKKPRTEEQLQGLLGFERFSAEEDTTDFAETWAAASRNTMFLSLLVFCKDLDKLLKDINKLGEGQKLDASHLKLRATLLWEELEENPAWPDSQNLRAQFQVLWDTTGDQLQWGSSKFFQIYAAKTSIEDFLKKHYLKDKYHYVDWTKPCPPDHLWVRVFEKGIESQAAEELKVLDNSRWRKNIQAFQTSPEADRILKAYKNSALNAPGVFEFLDSSLTKIDAAVELAKEEVTCTIQLMRTIFRDSPSINGLAQIRAITDRLRRHFVERVYFNVHLRKDRIFQELKYRLRKMQPSSGLDPGDWAALWNAVLFRFELALNMNLGKTYSDDYMASEPPQEPAAQPQTGGILAGQPEIKTANALEAADTLKTLWPLAVEASKHPDPTDGMIQWAEKILAKHERAMQTRDNGQGRQTNIKTANAQEIADTLEALWPLAVEASKHPDPTDGMIQWAEQIIPKRERAVQTRNNGRDPALQLQQGLLPSTQAPAATGIPSLPARPSRGLTQWLNSPPRSQQF